MIGNRINKLYNELGLTQYQFAEEIGFTHSAISHIEKGTTKNVSKKLLQAIYRRFDAVRPEWLEHGKGKMFIPEEKRPMEIIDNREISKLDFCLADSVCKQICEICMTLPPNKKERLLGYAEGLMDIKVSKIRNPKKNRDAEVN